MVGNIIRWSAQSAIRLLAFGPFFFLTQVKSSRLSSLFFKKLHAYYYSLSCTFVPRFLPPSRELGSSFDFENVLMRVQHVFQPSLSLSLSLGSASMWISRREPPITLLVFQGRLIDHFEGFRPFHSSDCSKNKKIWFFFFHLFRLTIYYSFLFSFLFFSFVSLLYFCSNIFWLFGSASWCLCSCFCFGDTDGSRAGYVGRFFRLMVSWSWVKFSCMSV